MKSTLSILSIITLSMTGAYAATLFNAAIDSNFATVGNWDNGLPGTGNDGMIDAGNVADLAIAHSGGTSTLTVGGNGSTGTLNINDGGKYSTANGGASDVRVGVGAGSVGIIHINNGGVLSVLGASADVFIGDSSGGLGSIIVADGGTLDARKALEIINGTLTLEVGAIVAANTPKDELVIDNAGILSFFTDGSTVTTIPGATLGVQLGSTSTLHMSLGGVFNVGDTWTILTDASGFSGVSGGDGTGVFGTVSDPSNAANQFAVHYGSGQAAVGEIVVELTQVPEPSSVALLGLGCLALILRRRR